MININTGYECGDAIDCNMAKKCKYKRNYRLYNFSVNIHRFFEYRLHIKLPYLICFNKKWEKLSGTTKCPYHKSRNYTCFDCKHMCGIGNCNIHYKDRLEYIPQDGWGKYSRCGSFGKSEWADNYKYK